MARNNSVGVSVLFLPHIFDDRPDTRRITIRNVIIANNKPNIGTPGSVVSLVPPGIGVLVMGTDDSLIRDNLITDNGLTGIGIVDYCIAVADGPLDCSVNPDVTPGFLADSEASNNRVIANRLQDNGIAPDLTHPLAFIASNLFGSFFSLFGELPACQPESPKGWPEAAEATIARVTR